MKTLQALALAALVGLAGCEPPWAQEYKAETARINAETVAMNATTAAIEARRVLIEARNACLKDEIAKATAEPEYTPHDCAQVAPVARSGRHEALPPPRAGAPDYGPPPGLRLGGGPGSAAWYRP